ncbi:S66 peptidase family protein [Solibacillus sp. FSL H8-0538]|uniref:S66 peptidase family protein n=1 Tax=Solibacillus sp. FSL H8-0538 TaxID=2921400 RepID=UPI0030FB869C
MKIRPNRIQQGDTVGVVALSSPVNMEQLGDRLKIFQELGLRYKLGNTIAPFDGYLAGTDAERVADLHEMVRDSEVKGIFCVRGGYGLGRIADQIDYALLEENPKIIWGFSDVTYLHTAVNEFSDLVTFHGPMLSGGDAPLDELSKKMYQQLFNPMEIQYSEMIAPLQTIHEGVARGEITGGNLNRFTGTLGTKFEIDVRGKLLLMEDVGESIERIDSMLNQLRLARKLEQAAGFIIGSFTKLGNGETEEDVVSLIADYIRPFNKPAVAGFKIGHCEPNIGIPLGVDAILDANEKVLRILPGVQ